MRGQGTKRSVRPIFFGVAAFLLLLVVTQYAAYLRYRFNGQREKDALEQELNETKGHFRDLLTHSISSANTIAVLYKQDPFLKNFDSAAKHIIEYDNTIAFISFADHFTVTHVYPHEGNDLIMGHNLLEIPLFRKEIDLVTTNKKVLFAGPYELVGNRGLAIACRIPVIRNGNIAALINVITKLSTIQEILPQLQNRDGKFVFQLSKKNPLTQKTEQFLSNYQPRDNQQIAVYIPEGDWILRIGYDGSYPSDIWPYVVALFGLALSVLIGFFTYSRAKLPEKMQRIINAKTRELAASEKYYRTLIESSTDAIVLFDKDGTAIYRTASFENVTGYTKEDMQRMYDIEMVVPEEREATVKAFQELVATTNGIVHRRICLQHKKGHRIYIDGVYRNMLHDENIKAVVCTYSDVTEKESAYHQLGERVKELSTIFKLNDILKDDHQDNEKLFQRIVDMLPLGWQFPDDCRARIEFDGNIYATADYPASAVKQDTMFRLMDGRSGRIEIVYTREKPAADEGPFLKEERDLLDTVADTITIYFNKALQQRSLRESEAKFRGAFEHAAIGMTLASLDGQWLMVNTALCEMLGYTEQELISMSFLSVTHPEDIVGDRQAVQQLKSGELKYYRAHKRYMHKDGRIVWVIINVAAIRNEKDEPLYFVAQINDITQRVESQLKFQNLVEKSLVSVYIAQDGKFVYANPTLIEETGYTEEELYSKSTLDFVYHEDRPMVQKNVDARIAGALDTTHYEIRVVRKNGTLIWAEFYGTSTIYNGNKAVIGTIINITSRKQLEIERQAIIEELLQRNRDLEQFNQILSHNVRAPLATILGLADLMRTTESEEENRFIIKGIEQSSKQLDIVINDLNDILHARSGLAEAKTIVKLEEILFEVKNLLRTMIKESNAEIVHDFSTANEIESVRSFIHSIFYNLITNAIKYAHKDRPPHIRILAEKQNGNIVLQFSDNGMGIDMERYKDQVFVLYKRFHQNVDGKGLGLFMVKTQVEALKGSIEVISKVGEGTRFVIKFNR
jgi:PAS domain S-box-containing protein